MVETPWLILWIGEVKMGEEIVVGEMEQPGGVIGHVVVGIGFVVTQREVTVEALVERHLAEKGSRGGGRGDGALTSPVEGGEVVGARTNGALAYIETLGGRFVMEECAG
jgi:hypothetical protein